MQIPKEIITFLARYPEASINGAKISIDELEEKMDYAQRQIFWSELFTLFQFLNMQSIAECTFIYAEPGELLPLTFIESCKIKLGMTVKERRLPDTAKTTNISPVSLFHLTEEAINNRVLILGVNDEQYEKLKPLDLQLSVLMLPIVHKYRLGVMAGQLNSVTVY